VVTTGLKRRGTQGERSSGFGLSAGFPPVSLYDKAQKRHGASCLAPPVKLPSINCLRKRVANTLVYLTNAQKSFSLATSNLLRFKVKFLAFPQRAQQAKLKCCHRSIHRSGSREYLLERRLSRNHFIRRV
jgi:hypothetical protein